MACLSSLLVSSDHLGAKSRCNALDRFGKPHRVWLFGCGKRFEISRKAIDGVARATTEILDRGRRSDALTSAYDRFEKRHTRRRRRWLVVQRYNVARCRSVLAKRTPDLLASRPGGLAVAQLHLEIDDTVFLELDELVDHTQGRGVPHRRQVRADAERVDGSACRNQIGDRPLVEITACEDSG